MKLFKKNKEQFIAPMSGKQIAIADIPDPVFSEKLMGDGFAIEISDSKVVAPLSGEIIATFPSGHAYGIRTKNGLEVLLHIGLDTVQLETAFNPKVVIGDTVKQGDVLVEVDIPAIKNANLSTISPVIFTSKESVTPLKLGSTLTIGETDICKYKVNIRT